jgi:hypothetical protein
MNKFIWSWNKFLKHIERINLKRQVSRRMLCILITSSVEVVFLFTTLTVFTFFEIFLSLLVSAGQVLIGRGSIFPIHRSQSTIWPRKLWTLIYETFDSLCSPIKISLINPTDSPCYVGFEVLTAVSTKMAVFWVVAPCSLVKVYQRFRGPCCLHHQGDESHGATTQKTAVLMLVIFP